MTHWQDYDLDPPDTGWIEECRDCGIDTHVDELCGPVLCEMCQRASLRRDSEKRRDDLSKALRDIGSVDLHMFGPGFFLKDQA